MDTASKSDTLVTRLIEDATFDPREGLGAVPFNVDVDYRGFRVRMTPSCFLELASYVAHNEPKVAGLAELIKGGRSVGPPFLQAEWNPIDRSETTYIWSVVGHEGRHRMKAIKRLEGDAPVEVHIFPRGLRARDVTQEMLDSFCHCVMSESGYEVDTAGKVAPF